MEGHTAVSCSRQVYSAVPTDSQNQVWPPATSFSIGVMEVVMSELSKRDEFMIFWAKCKMVMHQKRRKGRRRKIGCWKWLMSN